LQGRQIINCIKMQVSLLSCYVPSHLRSKYFCEPPVPRCLHSVLVSQCWYVVSHLLRTGLSGYVFC
jgi:hypothetical protein